MSELDEEPFWLVRELMTRYLFSSTATPSKSQGNSSTSTLVDVEGILGLPPSLLQMTEDQLPGTALTSDPSFVCFSPPLDHEDYLWGLENGEGVSDFFDNYDLGDLLQS